MPGLRPRLFYIVRNGELLPPHRRTADGNELVAESDARRGKAIAETGERAVNSSVSRDFTLVLLG
ncbi:hypothetical protein [Leptolyngbya sp. NM3-A1]|uniref:hypothetical protein n=1 Tax=unclassified Leptolyngbya TaxID=2650499 RepID=UPI003298E113